MAGMTFRDRVMNARSAGSIRELVRQQLEAMDRADALRAAKQKPARRTADAPRPEYDPTLGGRAIPRPSREPERSCTPIPSRDSALMQDHLARQAYQRQRLAEMNQRNAERWGQIMEEDRRRGR
ncbi:MAG: hypothetical protein JOY71_10155 [Acetobacteraceae bacterium]|nr:hypothetical protein [Acetobacteraceae bacterium]